MAPAQEGRMVQSVHVALVLWLPHLDSNQEPSDSSFEKESDHGAEIFILRPECPDLPPNVYGQVAA